MCGIAGLYDFQQAILPQHRQDAVKRFCAMQTHRGPDATGLWTSADTACVLGHTRLSIIDLDARSNQPMLDASGRFVVSFNGEIYNFLAIKAELEKMGARFRTSSDTEVLIEGYARWGESLFARLDGMFAAAIFDTVSGNLCLARDRLGEKPLYVANVDGAISFSSELKPLLTTPGFSREVTDASLYEFFTLRYVADPNTIFANIRSVQPGTILLFTRDGKRTEKSYYAFDLPTIDKRAMRNPDEYLAALDHVLTESVRTRLVADVPVGAFLSSGIDSSLVCAIAAKKIGSNVKCFSAGFVGGKENETDAARQIAQHLDLPFESYLVSPEDMMQTASNFGEILDEPNGDRSCVPMYFLSRLVRSRVTVAISGDGGDELFGGYTRYVPWKNHDNMSETDSVLRYFSERLPVFPVNPLDDALPGEKGSFRRRVASRFVTAFARRDLHDIERLRLIDMHSYLPGAVLAKVDRMSMKHSLEVRTPFFSPLMLKLSSQLPMPLCTDGKEFKLALRRVLSRYLPVSSILPGKQGFGMPVSFFTTYGKIFDNLARNADDALSAWTPFRDRPETFAQLRTAARQNINSYWAWIVLGQWTQSLPNSVRAA